MDRKKAVIEGGAQTPQQNLHCTAWATGLHQRQGPLSTQEMSQQLTAAVRWKEDTSNTQSASAQEGDHAEDRTPTREARDQQKQGPGHKHEFPKGAEGLVACEAGADL